MLRPGLFENDTYGLSNALWGKVPLEYIFGFSDRRCGIGLIDDFVGFGESSAVSSNVGRYNSNGIAYRTWEETSGIVTPSAAYGGTIALEGDSGATDNDCAAIQAGGGTMCPFAVIPGTSGSLFFEARFKVSSVAASIGNFFVGLGGSGLGATSDLLITDSNAFVTNGSFLGFGRLGASTTALGLFYERSGGTTGTKAAVGTLVADTYIKAGFVFDGANGDLLPWIDGVAIPGSRVSAASAAATPWPDGYMTLLASIKQMDATTPLILTLDWWAVAQLAAA
jgi:hypothetical protein